MRRHLQGSSPTDDKYQETENINFDSANYEHERIHTDYATKSNLLNT